MRLSGGARAHVVRPDGANTDDAAAISARGPQCLHRATPGARTEAKLRVEEVTVKDKLLLLVVGVDELERVVHVDFEPLLHPHDRADGRVGLARVARVVVGNVEDHELDRAGDEATWGSRRPPSAPGAAK